MQQENLFSGKNTVQDQSTGHVTCLGKTFNNDQERRDYFLALLAEKLRDPEFRKIEGFPIGNDEDILNLSDPPYYTACPNPWISEIISNWEVKSKNSAERISYSREPFSTDVSEGKTDQFYRAHTYHTKVPHKAIMRYILHYTNPNDIIYDGFCGSGMTGVAAQMCADRNAITDLGYHTDDKGNIFHEQTDATEGKSLVAFSKIGARRVLLNDLSPAATFIAARYNIPFLSEAYEAEINKLLLELENEIGWMYETKHTDNSITAKINYTVWSEVFSCSECGKEIVFLKDAYDQEQHKVKDKFNCPSCNTVCTKDSIILSFESKYDKQLGDVIKTPKRIPVLINYSAGNQVFEKKPDEFDLSIIEKIEAHNYLGKLPTNALPNMQMANVGRMKTTNVTHIHKFFLTRQAAALGLLWEKANKLKDADIKSAVLWTIEQSIPGLSILNRYQPIMHGKPGGSQVNRQMAGVFYVPSQISECSPWYNLNGKIKRVAKAFTSIKFERENAVIFTGTCSASGIPDNSLDYVFTDPPFGENIYYSDLNYLVESWHGVKTNTKSEAIIDRVKNKALPEYQTLIENCFREYYRTLKPGRWITIEFSNTKASVWNSIQTAIANAGFIVASVSALDKKQGTFQAVNTPTAVKQDLVISAYKPNNEFEERFLREAKTEEGVWDFVRTHFKYLPITKQQDNISLYVPERDPRILFDKMVSYYVRKGYPVPISSQEFQIGLGQRFIERDGMYFLPEQVPEYDRKKMLSGGVKQISMFVSDEASAIQWIRYLIKNKPQTFSDINPQFMQQLNGWSKNEMMLDLRELLSQNFLCYDGEHEVPDQIHSYLSSNWKELRNLPKNDPTLVAKAKDRWYVPDPNKASDLEKLREKALLKEFEEYKAVKKKLKIFRIEAVRVGFKKLWEQQEFATLIAIADKLPNSVLEEDPVLLMYYDQAVTLSQIDSDDEW